LRFTEGEGGIIWEGGGVDLQNLKYFI